MSYQLVSDATLDLPLDLVEQYQLAIIPMTVNLDGEEIQHYPDERNLTTEDFYTALKEGKKASTSQINPATYVDFFTPILEAGQDVLYICFTSGLSGTYQSALVAKGMLEEDFPERRIEIVDSLCASAGQGFFVYLVAQKKEAGLSLEELTQWALENRTRVAHWFTVDDLFHLQRGGRLTFAEAMLGSALKIKPVISVNGEGKLYVENKLRGNRKSMEYLLRKVEETLDDTEHTVFIGHGDAQERALALKEQLEQRTKAENIHITKIGPVIGSHTGPGMLAVLFLAKEPRS
jgi:DegV family protein with EDD domain